MEKVRWCHTFVVWLSTTTSPLNSIRFAIAACVSFMMSCHFVWCEKSRKGENVKTCAVNHSHEDKREVMFSKAAVELLSSAMSSSYQWSNNYNGKRMI
jgi:hypothetical protein